jgi:hypothetical protein
LRKLLERNPKKRLGFNGAEEVKSHPWFKNLNWEEVYNKQLVPPKPKCKQVKFFEQNKALDLGSADSKGEELYGWNFVDENFL